MLEAGNRHFLIVQALVNKTICVTTSDFCFIAKNLRIFKFCLLYHYDRKKCKISCSLIRKINYTTRKSVKYYIKTIDHLRNSFLPAKHDGRRL